MSQRRSPPGHPLDYRATVPATDISPARQLAARMLRISGWLYTGLGALVAGIGLVCMIVDRLGPPSFPNLTWLLWLMLGFGAANLALGIAYLIGAAQIGTRSHAWVTATLVLAICHEVLVILPLLALLYAMMRLGSVGFAACMNLLFAVEVAALIWDLARLQKEMKS